MLQIGINQAGIDWPSLSRRAPAIAGTCAYRRFCTPALSERRAPDHDKLVARARHHLTKARHLTINAVDADIATYILEPDAPSPSTKTAILVHGWTSESSFMMALAEPLRRSGLRVVLFDCPAHGKSSGQYASLISCARAFIDVVAALKSDGITPNYGVSHSMGGLIVLRAAMGNPPLQRAEPLEKYVLISTPNRFANVTADFGNGLGLTPAAQRQYERLLMRIAHQPISKFNACDYLRAIDRPALLLHSDDDHEIIPSNSVEIAEHCPTAELQMFSGMGHRRILFAGPVIRAAVKYLSPPKPE